ncbi:MAG TPA: molecular chaperone TorD family protein [Steroidobacteraceae bacterium]|nr:molecular chaperone TorD family protein [Steroidobacteraceae bacterium]
MSITHDTDRLALAQARAAAYALIAHGFQYPDGEWYELLCQPQRWNVWPGELERMRPGVQAFVAEVQRALVQSEWSASFSNAGSPLRRFQVAYDALFGHAVSGKCAAYETEYGDGEINQRSAQLADLAGFYQAFGLEPASRESDRPDFISVECEFMSVLCAKEAHSRRTGNDAGIDCCIDAQATFLNDHLARWLPAFAHRVGEVGADPFYDALGRLACELLALECAQFGLPLGPRWLQLRPADPEGETTISCLDATGCGPGSVACAPAQTIERVIPLNVDIGDA